MTRKVVLITGGSRGIGRAMVERFKEAGWTTASCSSRMKGLTDIPADFKFVCDVANRDQVKAGIGNVLKACGRIDAVINNAGVAGENSLDPADDDEFWQRVIDVNLNGTYYVSKYALPHLPEGGRIVNIASVLALKGVPDQTAYCAAKHGVLGFTRALSHHAASRKITVNAICPGWTRTEMAEGRMAELGLDEEALERSVPLGRMIEPREVAELALFLCSEGASGITGQALTIDGGTLA